MVDTNSLSINSDKKEILRHEEVVVGDPLGVGGGDAAVVENTGGDVAGVKDVTGSDEWLRECSMDWLDRPDNGEPATEDPGEEDGDEKEE